MTVIPLHRRISNKLARLALVMAMAVGVLVSVVQVSHDFTNQRQEHARIVTRILNAANPTAQRAILTLDPFLAQEVVNGLISYEYIISALFLFDKTETFFTVEPFYCSVY